MTGSPAIAPPLLWLTVTHPGQRHAGNQVYSGGLLDSLGALGQPITLLTTDDGPPIAGVRVIAAAPPAFRPRLPGLLSRWPASVWQLAHPALRRAFRRLLAERSWRAVVVDQAACGWALPALHGHCPPIVYIAHNREGDVRAEVARNERSPVKRAVMRLDAAKYARLETALTRRATLITAITREDATAFARAAGQRRVLELPPGYSGSRVPARTITADTPRRVIVVGRFEWQAKQQNLRQWAEEAVPILDARGVETVVIGTVPPALQRQLARPGLRFAGRLPDLAPHLAEARFGLVAEGVGGGFKLKALDYIFHRVPIAALDGNLAGQPPGVATHTLVAEAPAALAASITATIDNIARLNQMQNNAFTAASAAFDWTGRARQFLAALDRIDRKE